jgi:FimV-like protein
MRRFKVRGEDAGLHARALDYLGCLLQQRGDTGGAERCFRAAMGTGHPYWADEALLDLAELLIDLGRTAEARELLTELQASSPLPEHAEHARALLDRLDAPE